MVVVGAVGEAPNKLPISADHGNLSILRAVAVPDGNHGAVLRLNVTVVAVLTVVASAEHDAHGEPVRECHLEALFGESVERSGHGSVS